MKVDWTIISHYITQSFSFWMVGRICIMSLGLKGLKYDGAVHSDCLWQTVLVPVLTQLRSKGLTDHLPTTFRPSTSYQSPTNHLWTTYQPSTDHLPTSYWPPTNHLTTTYRPPTNHLPTTYRPLTDHLPITYQPPMDHLPTIYRPPTDHAPVTNHLWTTYQPVTDHLPTTYWPPTNHLPTTYWPLFLWCTLFNISRGKGQGDTRDKLLFFLLILRCHSCRTRFKRKWKTVHKL